MTPHHPTPPATNGSGHTARLRDGAKRVRLDGQSRVRLDGQFRPVSARTSCNAMIPLNLYATY